MRYENVKRGIFLARPNRFIALVELDGATVVCHVKNTGRCRELLIPGTAVYLTPGLTPGRKTPFDLIAVEKGQRLINMDAQAPNRVFAEWARRYEPQVNAILPEYRCGQSRLDFCLETPDGHHFVEVKGVTLERGGHTFFPDAPTERGVKHLRELIRLAGEGYRTTVFFVIQMANVADFSPNDATHPMFGQVLRAAAVSGVKVAAYSCRVNPDSMEIDREIPVLL
ncbi:MAG: DNA/RNA nuclease SfsA [Oscillospiraceae bacterium]|nr:DNA/RNA nuclease SfsA [Oscillospiraceae bacterium]